VAALFFKVGVWALIQRVVSFVFQIAHDRSPFPWLAGFDVNIIKFGYRRHIALVNIAIGKLENVLR
jgi:hypothetical protein